MTPTGEVNADGIEAAARAMALASGSPWRELGGASRDVYRAEARAAAISFGLTVGDGE